MNPRYILVAERALHRCEYCHAPESDAVVRLFHPREERWDDHFWVNFESGAIVGRTASGRASIIRLEMNSQLQLMAQRQWMSLGIFP